MIDNELIRTFNIEMSEFYKHWAEYELSDEQGPDMCECFDWDCWYFCEEHGINYQEFRKVIIPFADKYIQLNKDEIEYYSTIKA